MISFDNGEFFFNRNRCCQCGTCLAACRNNALSAHLKPDELYDIECNRDMCSGCQLCAISCPAATLPNHIFMEKDWHNFRGLYIGRSKDANIASKASSGGVARTLVKMALERSLVEKAYCLVRTGQYPWAEGQYLKDCNDTATIANSMYLPILVNANLKTEHNIRKLLLVGTPCQLLGAESLFPRTNIKIVKIALLCKQQKTFEFTKFIGRRLKVKVNRETPVQYRGDGWPGMVRILDKKIAWADAASLPYAKQLWMISGCRFCGDPFGCNADITLSDPWGLFKTIEYGQNLIWVRTAEGAGLLDSFKDGFVLEEMPLAPDEIHQLVDWQYYRRKQALIPHYLGHTTRFPDSLLVRLSDWQRRLYEALLEVACPPSLLLKLMGRLPFADSLIRRPN